MPEIKYHNGAKVMIGDIVEYPNKQGVYDCSDIIGVTKILEDSHAVYFSDGKVMGIAGPNFWRLRLIARKISK